MTEQTNEILGQEITGPEPSAEYAHNTEIPKLFGKPMLRGNFSRIDPKTLHADKFVLFYSHPNGEMWVGDAIAWLQSLENETADLVFADPPYNIKKAVWDTFESQQANVEWSIQWIKEVRHVLKPEEMLYI